jgi:hypothetical protein
VRIWRAHTGAVVCGRLVCEHSEAPRRLKGAGRHVFQKIGDVLHTPATELPTIGLSIPHRHPSRLLKQVFSPLPAGFFLPVRSALPVPPVSRDGDAVRKTKRAVEARLLHVLATVRFEFPLEVRMNKGFWIFRDSTSRQKYRQKKLLPLFRSPAF